MSGHQLADPGKHRLGSSYVAECQILRQRSAIELGRNSRIGKDCLDLRAKQKCAAIPAVIERLDAETVAGGEQHAPAAVPDGKAKHAAQMLYAIAAVFLVQMDYGFGVAVGTVAVSAGLERGAQFCVVVDFAV